MAREAWHISDARLSLFQLASRTHRDMVFRCFLLRRISDTAEHRDQPERQSRTAEHRRQPDWHLMAAVAHSLGSWLFLRSDLRRVIETTCYILQLFYRSPFGDHLFILLVGLLLRALLRSL